jgi:glycosyltransferase involved in cell wall biosynthesis
MIRRGAGPNRVRQRDNTGGAATRPMRVLHVIGDTDVGGAEAILFNVVTRLSRSEFESRVVSLLPIGKVGHQLRAAGMEVDSLNLTRSWKSVPQAVHRFAAQIRAWQPDVVQTWMYHADLLGGIAARLTSSIPVVWSVHHASLDCHTDSRNTRMSASLCSRLSRYVPSRIAVVSESALRVHAHAGYDASKLTVIRNGFDVSAFRPNAAARAQIRADLKLGEQDRLVGLIGRFHPAKDHATFVRAAALAGRCDPQVQFVCAGAGADWNNSQLADWIAAESLRARFHLLGLRSDVPRLMASLDLAVCCSRTEAFPSVVGEAMACEVPCVVTDVGDCRAIVGDAGITVPPGNAAALADAVIRALSLPAVMRNQWGRAARRRIIENYTIEETVRGYTRVWRDVVADRHDSGRIETDDHVPLADSIAA